mmetsp:Transcript_12153/g.30199  ORF Transcript_12153/g.30199 Transcript_12153/m.30199 type:complete len:194 (-) Transcript_12153:823-1404(-)
MDELDFTRGQRSSPNICRFLLQRMSLLSSGTALGLRMCAAAVPHWGTENGIRLASNTVINMCHSPSKDGLGPNDETDKLRNFRGATITVISFCIQPSLPKRTVIFFLLFLFVHTFNQVDRQFHEASDFVLSGLRLFFLKHIECLFCFFSFLDSADAQFIVQVHTRPSKRIKLLILSDIVELELCVLLDNPNQP